MDERHIARTHALYNKVALWILAAMTLTAFAIMSVADTQDWTAAIVVSVVFNYGCCFAYGLVWKQMARRSPELLPKLYLASSALRLLLGATALLIGCVVMRHQPELIKSFAIVFVIYYLVVLIFDAIFFAKISKQNNL